VTNGVWNVSSLIISILLIRNWKLLGDVKFKSFFYLGSFFFLFMFYHSLCCLRGAPCPQRSCSSSMLNPPTFGVTTVKKKNDGV
jgi:hypothetical protein